MLHGVLCIAILGSFLKTVRRYALVEAVGARFSPLRRLNAVAVSRAQGRGRVSPPTPPAPRTSSMMGYIMGCACLRDKLTGHYSSGLKLIKSLEMGGRHAARNAPPEDLTIVGLYLRREA
ncbi:hypothetical protein EVAR_54650_1 [Eumeta japonica]|uniref:Uncharacterized protein n=1 Tax=Eumeta variegata TaxID=151549 RepID=A0A4C1XAB6_EUMVA|nr:hypothetical protein EVAR_54650_1 [Eumeta japonica]